MTVLSNPRKVLVWFGLFLGAICPAWGQQMTYQQCVDIASKLEVQSANLQAARNSVATATGVRAQALTTQVKQLEQEVGDLKAKQSACARLFPADKAQVSECDRIASEIAQVQGTVRGMLPQAQAGNLVAKSQMDGLMQRLGELRTSQQRAGCPTSGSNTTSGTTTPTAPTVNAVNPDCAGQFATLQRLRQELATLANDRARKDLDISKTEIQLRDSSLSSAVRSQLAADLARYKSELADVNRRETYNPSQISIIRENMINRGCSPDTGKAGGPTVTSKTTSSTSGGATGGTGSSTAAMGDFAGTWIATRLFTGGQQPWGTLILRKTTSGTGRALAGQPYGRRTLSEDIQCKREELCQYYEGEIRWSPEWIQYRQGQFATVARGLQQTPTAVVVALTEGGALQGRFNGEEGIAGIFYIETGYKTQFPGSIRIDGRPAVRFGSNMRYQRVQ